MSRPRNDIKQKDELPMSLNGIHLKLDDDGEIHMERDLPFMLVYRTPDFNKGDHVISNLIKNEASYFIISDSKYNNHKNILHSLVKNMSDKFGAFLLIEIWPGYSTQLTEGNKAGLEILGPSDFIPNVVEPLKANIEKMKLTGLKPSVEITASANRCPDHKEPLLDRNTLKQLECLLLGIKIEPFYKNTFTGSTYPLLERQMYSEFSVVFKKFVFEFVSVQASHNFTGFQSLAKRKIQPEVWEIDQKIVDIDSQLSFLMLVSPVNTNSVLDEFIKSKFKKKPVFHYRMMPVDPAILKRNLYNIPIEKIDDPTLGYLFYEKRAEADKMLSMLNDRDSRDFFYGSLQLFGPVGRSLLETARQILKDYPVNGNIISKNEKYYNAEEFARIAEEELRNLKKQCPEMSTKVEIKDTISNMMVDKGVLNIPQNSKIRHKRSDALIQHEIGTHVLTYYNGKSQPLKLLSSGVPGYEELQEGIAVLAEYLCGGLSKKRMQILAARVIAVDSMINHNDFIATFELLVDEYKFSIQEAFHICTRVYRGGGLTKDAIYLRGLIELLKYLREGNPLEPLLIGKIRQNYLPVIEELIARKVLLPICLKPGYLRREDSLMRLAQIKEVKQVTELINADL